MRMMRSSPAVGAEFPMPHTPGNADARGRRGQERGDLQTE